MKLILAQKSYLAIAVASIFAGSMAQAAIEEIIVTANKREQTLQDIPVSVSDYWRYYCKSRNPRHY